MHCQAVPEKQRVRDVVLGLGLVLTTEERPLRDMEGSAEAPPPPPDDLTVSQVAGGASDWHDVSG